MEKNAEKDEDEYLKDVEAATGVNLRNPGEKSRRIIAKKREKSEKEKSRDRLKVFILIFKPSKIYFCNIIIIVKEKLFNKQTIRRVSKALTDMQKARAERKFAHQFNYSITNKR